MMRISKKVGRTHEEGKTVHRALVRCKCEACLVAIAPGELFVPIKTDFSFFCLCQECHPFELVEES